jgi:hypothetical protein
MHATVTTDENFNIAADMAFTSTATPTKPFYALQ